MTKELDFMVRTVDFANLGSLGIVREVEGFLRENKKPINFLSAMPRARLYGAVAEFRENHPQDPEETHSFTRRRFLANLFKVATAIGVAAYGFNPRMAEAILPILTGISDRPVFGRNIGYGRDGQGHLNGINGKRTNIPGIDFLAQGEIIVSVAAGHVYRGSSNPYDVVMSHEVMGGAIQSAYLHNSARMEKVLRQDVKRGTPIAITGVEGARKEHLHLEANSSDPEDFGFYEKQPVQGYSNLPYYDGKADLDSALRVRPRQRLLQERLDTLDQRMGNYDGPLRKELNSLKSDPAKLFRRLYDEVALNLVFLPGEDGYRLFLEGNLYVQHPYMKKIVFTNPFKPAKLVNRYK